MPPCDSEAARRSIVTVAAAVVVCCSREVPPGCVTWARGRCAREHSASNMSSIDFDEVLLHVGEKGRYQNIMYYLLCIPATLPAAFLAFSQVHIYIKTYLSFGYLLPRAVRNQSLQTGYKEKMSILVAILVSTSGYIYVFILYRVRNKYGKHTRISTIQCNSIIRWLRSYFIVMTCRRRLW